MEIYMEHTKKFAGDLWFHFISSSIDLAKLSIPIWKLIWEILQNSQKIYDNTDGFIIDKPAAVFRMFYRIEKDLAKIGV